MSWPAILGVAAALVGAGLILYWLLIVTEGTFLGARVVALLYDWVARRYDGIKAYSPAYEELFLARPMLAMLQGVAEPLVLDVATGTGRVPGLLLADASFGGRVIGLDFSRRMLAQAAGGLAEWQTGRTALIWQNAMELPFPSGLFDMVTCLESLEFMPDPQQVLAEVVRVTRPGGGIVVTRRRGWEARVMPGKCWSEEEVLRMLAEMGLERVRAVPWQLDYDLVFGRKEPGDEGEARPGPRDWMAGVLCCPECGRQELTKRDSVLNCRMCNQRFLIGRDGVIELARSAR